MAFPTARLEGCFPELFGFVLLDAAGLGDVCAGSPVGRNLLQLFSSSEQGDQVIRDGTAIPVLNVEPATTPCSCEMPTALHHGSIRK